MELIVVMAIIGIIATATAVTFGNFGRTQKISIAYDNVSSALAEAKSKALSQVVINCDESLGVLEGYQVRFTEDSSSYTLEEVCEEDDIPTNTPTAYTIRTTMLPGGLVFNNTEVIMFKVLTGGANGLKSVTFTNPDSGRSKTINVSSSGIISEDTP